MIPGEATADQVLGIPLAKWYRAVELWHSTGVPQQIWTADGLHFVSPISQYVPTALIVTTVCGPEHLADPRAA